VNRTRLANYFHALLIALLASACGGKSPEQTMTSAKSHLERHEYTEAVIELKSALQKEPNLGEARYLLGVALLDQGEAGASALELEKARDLRVADDLVFPKLARAWLGSGKNREVITAFGDVKLPTRSAEAELKTATAVAYARLDQKAKAEQAVDAALRVDEKLPWALLTKARLEAVAGQIDKALALTETAVTPGGDNGEAYLLRGALLRAGKNDLEGAIKAFQLASKPGRAELNARASLIQIYLIGNKLTAAKDELAALQKSYPKNPMTHYLDAVVALSSKDFDRAVAVSDQLLRFAPSSPQLLVLSGAANLRRGSLVAAETKLGKVVQTVEHVSGARRLLSETYLRMGQPEKAMAVLRPLLEGTNVEGDTYALAGQAQLQLGNTEEAEEMFAAAIRFKPNDAQLRTALALTDLLRGHTEASFSALQSIAASDKGEVADLALISAHLQRRNYDAALEAIDSLDRKLPGRASSHHMRGLALTGKGDMAGARAQFEAALKLDGNFFSAVLSLVGLDVRAGNLSQARSRLEHVIGSKSSNGTVARMALLELMHREHAAHDRLIAFIDEAINAAPAEAEPRLAKIAELAKSNDVKAAALEAQEALVRFPLNPAVLDAAGAALLAAGDVQQALSAYNKLASVAPKSPLPHLRISDLHARRGDSAASDASLMRAFETAPDSSDVQRRLLLQARRTKSFKTVIDAAKDLQKKSPQSASGFLLEGDAELERKNWDSAVSSYRKALDRVDRGGRASKQIYYTLQKKGDTDGAQRFGDMWLKTHPEDSSFVEYLGNQAILQRKFVEASKYFSELIKKNPLDRVALNNMAWLKAELGEKGAVEMAERALKLAPDSPPLLDTYAKALASEGRLDRAIEVQSGVVKTMSSDPNYRFRLAGLFAKAQRKEDALREIEVLQKLGSSFPRHAEVAQLRKKLGG
jgi:cellulose synthase operon protein C